MGTRWHAIRAHAAAVRTRYAEEVQVPAPLALTPDVLADLVDRCYLLTAYEDPTLDAAINGRLDPTIGSIRLRVGMSPTRMAFVIAHELGHFVLEGAAAGIVEDDDRTIDERVSGEQESEAGLAVYNTRERHEQEANLFALELLVPADALWQAVQETGWTISSLAQQFSVSGDAIRAQLVHVCCLEPVAPPVTHAASGTTADAPDPEQQAAVDAPLPTLLEAGPGTGKTRSIVAKYLSLVRQGVSPATILCLTFSNKAAEEMRQRIVAALQPDHAPLSTLVEVSTFHAWGLNVLRRYGHHVGLPPDTRLLTPTDLLLLQHRQPAGPPLDAYKALHDPGQFLPQIIRAISRAKDELRDPATYRALAEAEADRLLREVAPKTYRGKPTIEAQEAVRDAARLRELAAIYEGYSTMLAAHKALDYGDLILRTVEALRIPAVAQSAAQQYQAILVDEFQDINYASGELVRLLDHGRGVVWAVGDPWQAIYRFRGASPATLAAFDRHYPGASRRHLTRNYRSRQAILDASHAIMQGRDELAATRIPLQAQRVGVLPKGRPVIEWVVADTATEAAAIAHDILRRVRRPSLRLPGCMRPQRLQIVPRPQIRLSRRRWHFADHAVLCRTHRHAARVVAALEAHGIPVDWMGDIYEYDEVKDALAIVAATHDPQSAALLRILTRSEHTLTRDDLAALVQAAHATRRSLPQVVWDTTHTSSLSPEGQAQLAALRELLDTLAATGDAWACLTTYLFSASTLLRQQIVRAAAGDVAAQRALATLGQLIVAARTFVRQALPHQQGPGDFVAYVRLLIASDETPRARPIAGAHDVVRVMTVHAAKGLEFPVVYIPCLEQRQFPAQEQGSSIPPIPGLIQGEADADQSEKARKTRRSAARLHEERYLLYVAMTRARDHLVLSRVRPSEDQKKHRRSELLPGAVDGRDAPWPLRTYRLRPACVQAPQRVSVAVPPVVRMPVPASSLDTYDQCPRRFLYQYGYQLYDDLSPYLRMHQTIRRAVSTVREQARDGMLPPDETALRDVVWAIFAEYGLPDVLYADDYFAEAYRHVQRFWRSLQEQTMRASDINQVVFVPRPTGAVAVRVDQVLADTGRPRWIYTRTGEPGKEDHKSTRLTLYALAYAATHGEPANVGILYTATETIDPIELGAAALAKQADKVDELLAGITHGRWEPRPGPQCQTCAFNVICPV